MFSQNLISTKNDISNPCSKTHWRLLAPVLPELTLNKSNQMKYLFKNALEIGALVLPEFNLYEGRGVVAVQQGLCGVSV